MARIKNLLGKSVGKDTAYATWHGDGPLGNTTVLLLKTYQVPHKELKNQFARWFVAVKTDVTYQSWELGDSYLNRVVRGLTLVDASDKFKEQYWETISDLRKVANFE